MKNSTQPTPNTRPLPVLWQLHPKVLCAAALMAALSIVLGKYLAINITQSIRLSFENLPVLLMGVYFGPVIGGIVGAVADILGCLMVGYAINPIITLGAAFVGITSGLVGIAARRFGRGLNPLWVCLAVLAAHVVGSMLIKSIGIAIYYHTPMKVLLLRVPVYVVTGALEGSVLSLLTRSKLFMGELNRFFSRRTRNIQRNQ